jgi:hypothetical protein
MLVKNLLTGATLALGLAIAGNTNMSGAQQPAEPVAPAGMAAKSVDQSAGNPASAPHRGAVSIRRPIQATASSILPAGCGMPAP